jgi:hypothetical protein
MAMAIYVEQSQPNQKHLKMSPEESIDNGFIKTNSQVLHRGHLFNL